MRIGITIGDVTGIGPEVTLKTLASDWPNGKATYLLIGSLEFLREQGRRFGLNLSLEPFAAGDFRPESIPVLDPLALRPLAKNLPPGAPSAAQAALAYLREGARLCLSGGLDALVTAPVNKEAILRAGEPFVGQTEFLSQLAGAKRTAMMLLGEDDRGRWLRVALVTTHLPIRKVADEITQAKVELAIELAAQACRDLSLPRSKVAVCGLNPHAGEGGKVGTDEIDTIIPAVKAAQKSGIDVTGPFAADTLFYYAYRGAYDAVVAMYHDQGLVPLKMIGFERGVNWTLGLPFIRTSPDHGTAYDIAGQGRADPSSMRAAIELARQLARGGAKS
jgi:4-hydroxythreonine-4-phosphate dehydrogenase